MSVSQPLQMRTIKMNRVGFLHVPRPHQDPSPPLTFMVGTHPYGPCKVISLVSPSHQRISTERERDDNDPRLPAQVHIHCALFIISLHIYIKSIVLVIIRSLEREKASSPGMTEISRDAKLQYMETL